MRKIAILFACLALGTAAIGCNQKDTAQKAKPCAHGEKVDAKKCATCKICLKCGEPKGSEKCCVTEGREKCEKCGLLKGSAGCCKIPAKCCADTSGKTPSCTGAGHDKDAHKGHNHKGHKH